MTQMHKVIDNLTFGGAGRCFAQLVRELSKTKYRHIDELSVSSRII